MNAFIMLEDEPEYRPADCSRYCTCCVVDAKNHRFYFHRVSVAAMLFFGI